MALVHTPVASLAAVRRPVVTLTEEIGVLVVVQVGNANDDSCTGTISEWSAMEMYSRGGVGAYTQPMPKIPASAALVRRFICRFHTSQTGNRPRVRSHKVAVTL